MGWERKKTPEGCGDGDATGVVIRSPSKHPPVFPGMRNPFKKLFSWGGWGALARGSALRVAGRAAAAQGRLERAERQGAEARAEGRGAGTAAQGRGQKPGQRGKPKGKYTL